MGSSLLIWCAIIGALLSSYQASTLMKTKVRLLKSAASTQHQRFHRSFHMSLNTKSTPKIIIAGAPAAGKGTQCEVIKEEFGVIHLSTGDILRAAVKEGTNLGKQAKEFMDAGKLVPDELIIGVVCDRLKQSDCESKGWLLDGFPRTKLQADALSAAGIVPDCFILLDVPEDILVERVSGRRTDPVTGKIYHLKFNPPENDEIAARVVQRSDDTAEKIVVRYRDFESNINAIRSSYEDKLIKVDGTKSQLDVSQMITSALRDSQKRKDMTTAVNKVALGSVELSAKGKIARIVLGMLFFVGFDCFVAKVFQSFGWIFPSSVAGMIALFALLSSAHAAAPAAIDQTLENFLPVLDFIKSTMLLYFVPPLVVLPLKTHLLHGVTAKVLGVILIGLLASLAVSGATSEALRKVMPSSKTSADSVSIANAPAPGPKFDIPAIRPLLISALALVICKISGVGSRPYQTLIKAFGGASTVGSFLVVTKIAPQKLKSVVHPVLLTAAIAYLAQVIFALSTGQSVVGTLMQYYGHGLRGSGDLISGLLGPIVISFGFQLFQYRNMITKNAGTLLASTGISAAFGLASSAVLSRAFQLSKRETVLATLTRCITTPLALVASKISGADSSIAALIVVLTGVFGATFGEKFLRLLNIRSPESVGLALGSSAHGIGVASVANEPSKFSNAIVSMTLTGFWTVALLSYTPFRTELIKYALKLK